MHAVTGDEYALTSTRLDPEDVLFDVSAHIGSVSYYEVETMTSPNPYISTFNAISYP